MTEAAHEAVVPSTGAGGAPGTGREQLELEPGVVIEPAHLAQVVDHVRALRLRQRGVECQEVIECGPRGGGRGAARRVERGAMTHHEGQ